MKIEIKHELWNRIVQAVFIAGMLLSIVYGIYDLFKPGNHDIGKGPWIALAFFVAFESARSAIWRVLLRYEEHPRDRERASVYKFFFYGNRIVIFVFLLAGLWSVVTIAFDNSAGTLYVYQALGVVVLILWGVVFLSYFIWAIYFYNVNYGLPEEEWDKINDEKKKLTSGQPFKQEILDEEPPSNPYKDETFGLPPGTVRGMIAFTLLFGALCILFVRIGVKNEVDEGTVVWDQHEFFNNAFLMMIAFYFGSRSLEILTKKKALANAGSGSDVTDDDPNKNTNEARKADPNAGAITKNDPPIVPEMDPMTGMQL
jgi:hypothetical protein